mgnify:FL=1|tara:strand:- start:284 stop:445 length:162 start_codon:yes stop_codon:yes gene_type:complete
MTITITGQGKLEAKMDKAIKQMPTLDGTKSRAEFAVEGIQYYLTELKKKKIIT